MSFQAVQLIKSLSASAFHELYHLKLSQSFILRAAE